MKKNKFPILFFSIFGLVGLGLLIGGICWLISSMKFKEIAVEIPGEIVGIETYRDSDGDTHHRVFVDYSYNGIDYDGVQLGFYSSNMYEGKEITLLCDPENPGHIESSSGFAFGAGILLFMGLIFFLVGFIPIIISIKNNAKKKNLLATGQILHATVESIDYNTSYSVNGRHPFILYCTYYDQYKDVTYRFKSENLWTDPEPVLPPGSYVNVLVDASDYSKYHVDVDSAVNGRIVDYT